VSTTQTILTSAVAVVGTLAGGTLTSLFQSRTARVQREDTHRRGQQDAAVSAVAELVAAFDKHRGVMWNAEKCRLTGLSNEIDNADTRASRAEVSAPLTRVCLLVPALAPTARDAAFHTYSIRGCPDEDELDRRRQLAHDAMTRFVDTASALFSGAGIGLALPAADDQS
jgi:hypothetical protein